MPPHPRPLPPSFQGWLPVKSQSLYFGLLLHFPRLVQFLYTFCFFFFFGSRTKYYSLGLGKKSWFGLSYAQVMWSWTSIHAGWKWEHCLDPLHHNNNSKSKGHLVHLSLEWEWAGWAHLKSCVGKQIQTLLLCIDKASFNFLHTDEFRMKDSVWRRIF